ncbi:MAG: ArsA family ATPase [bacterium]|nr:ArsA family ATPase [bacterium]MCP5043764.1 ArsA family ATPase [bacterium]
MRVILHMGKGGVGKTTLSLATALGAAREGHRVCVLSTDSAHSLGDALGRPIGSKPVEVAEGLVAREIGVLDELASSWIEIQGWLRELLRDEADEMVVDELLVFPGLEELLALRAVCEIDASGQYDVCVVDCAPTGSALRMLRFPDALEIFMDQVFALERRGARLLRPLLDGAGVGRLIPSEAFFDAFERLYQETASVRRILTDDACTSARLVVNPASVVVAEARRTFAYLNLYGVATDAVLINRVLPESASGGYFARWAEREAASLEEIAASFPIPQFTAPLHHSEIIGTEAIAKLASVTYGERDPAEVMIHARPIRMRKIGRDSVIEIDLQGIEMEDIDLVSTGSELLVRVRDVSRRIALPASLAGLEIANSRFSRGVLSVHFDH